MRKDSPARAVIVVFCVALVCSLLVSTAAIVLRPLQERNELVRRSRNIVALTGLVQPGERLSNERVLEVAQDLDVRVVAIDAGAFDDSVDPAAVDERAAARDPARSTAIPPELDVARLGRRAQHKVAYLMWREGELDRLILPIHGQGMWSTMYGFIALEADLDTIADVTFYEQEETAGLGDQIMRRDWQVQWQGRRIFNDAGEVRFRVATGAAPEGAVNAVDGLTGATITGNGVTALVRYWFGPHGYAPFLDSLRANPPRPPAGSRDSRDEAS